MGGLWSDFDQMTSIPGLFVAGEAGWAYHGANRLGANSLLSACVDGWFTLPFSIPNYLAGFSGTEPLAPEDPAVVATLADVGKRVDALLSIGGTQGPDRFHRRLGEILYHRCGVSRDAEGLADAIVRIDELTADFWADLRVAGTGAQFNQELEKAGRVADFLGLARLMCIDALDRDESCGAHFRVEPNSRGGGGARRRALVLRVGLGTQCRRPRDPSRRTAVVHSRAAADEELHVKLTLQIWRVDTSSPGEYQDYVVA